MQTKPGNNLVNIKYPQIEAHARLREELFVAAVNDLASRLGPILKN